MKAFNLFLFSILFSISGLGQPPLASTQLVTEEYCGMLIEDHYRNLENMEAPEVQKWFKQQGDYTRRVLQKIPRRQFLIDQQLEFDKRQSYKITSLQITSNDCYFYLKKSANEQAAKLYYRKGFEGEEKLLYDPKDFKPNSGHTYLINYIKPDWEGEKVVISLTKNGEEISQMVIMNVKTQSLLPDLITNCWPSDGGGVSWMPDNSGFFYLHYPVIDPTSKLFLKNMKSVFYRIGQDSNELNEVFSNTHNPNIGIEPEDFPITTLNAKEDGYLLGQIAGASYYSDTYYAKIKTNSTLEYDWEFLFSKDDKVKSCIIDEDSLLFLTGKNASNFQICKTSLINPDFKSPNILVKEKEAEVIQSMAMTSEGVFFTTNKNGVESKLYHFKDGIEKHIPLPKKSGSIYLSSKGKNYSDLWVYTMGWSSNFRRFKYNFAESTFTDANLVPIPQFPEFEDLVVKEVLVKSHDGVEVPLSIIHKKGLEMNGKNPVIFYGYGGYGYSINPRFSPSSLLFTLEGGIYAVAHVRGGGEKGDAWHQAGRKKTKANTWKDLIACTEYMIQEGYTSSKYTAIWGHSAGGILIGRSMTERPDLFAVAIPQVGIMNALRFEKTPNGGNNIKELGSSKNLEECNALFEMDAYLHLQKNTDYPATLITAGMNDPRVIAWQPAKFAAKLQAYQKSNKPILFLVDYKSGHGLGDSRLKQYESLADVYAFTLWQMGHFDYQVAE